MNKKYTKLPTQNIEMLPMTKHEEHGPATRKLNLYELYTIASFMEAV